MFKSKKRVLVAASVAALALLAAFGAYAYWTTTGSGSGSAAAASSNGTLTLEASFDAGIYPGGSKSVSFTATNTSDTNLYVGTIELDSVQASDPDCDVDDFSMADVTSNTVVPANTTDHPLTGTGTLVFANTSVNQDDCKGATITLNVSST